jgi:hypothetical protein
VSSDPAIVSIEPDGSLIGHANGTATIHAPATESVLHVHVRQVSSIRINPGRVDLDQGASTRLSVFGDDEVELLPGGVQWAVTDAAVIIVSPEGIVTARSHGRAEAVARCGDVEARSSITVLAPPVPHFSVHPKSPRLAVGNIVTVQALALVGPVDVNWSSSSPGIVAALGNGVFRAVRRGTSDVCAIAGTRRSCTIVEVTE